MITKHTHDTLTWIDLESPTPAEARQLMDEYALHPLVANELLVPTLRPRIDVYDTYIYVVLHFPSMVHTHGNGKDQEIDFVVGKDFLITAHYHTIDPIAEFSKLFEIDSIIDKDNSREEHGGTLFYYMMRKLYENTMREVDSIEKVLDEIETKIFKEEEPKMVYEISQVSRKLLNFRQIMRPHQEIFGSLEFEIGIKKLFGEDAQHYIRRISGEFYKISAVLDSSQEMLTSLRDTNDSLLSSKTNDVMKTLTIMSFTALPLTVIASIFGMSSQYVPLVDKPGGFWLVIGLMVAAGIFTSAYFKFKKWL